MTRPTPMGVYLLPLLLILPRGHCAGNEVSGPKVTVQQGDVIGRTVIFNETTFMNITNKRIDVFQGIPYAEPPERFKLPVPKQPWSAVWNATSFAPSCSQDPHLYYPPSSEDCLYLNVYAPNPKPTQAAVMVWIHGGSIEIGTSMTWDFYGLPLVAVGDVILVTLNYRLGIFSQFTTRDVEAPGNLAMFDQVLALRWVNSNIAGNDDQDISRREWRKMTTFKEDRFLLTVAKPLPRRVPAIIIIQQNIIAFGGDTSRITIFGVSSGASSVSLHLLSKQSLGLFSQAIIQSGTSLAYWAFRDNRERDLQNARDLGLAMNCDVSNSSTLVLCLRTVPTDDLRRTAKKIYDGYTAMHTDESFLEDTPKAIYEAGDYAHVPVIIGFGKDEGTMIPSLSFPKYTGDTNPPFINKTTFEAFSQSFMASQIPDGDDGAILLDAVSQEYTDWSHADDASADYFQSLVDLGGDVIFSCPADAQLRFHAEAGDKVFAYFNTHAPSATSYAQVGDIVPFTPWVKAGHAEELMFVFGFPFIDELAEIHGHNMTDDEKDLSVKIMKMWSNFAKYGDPSKTSPNGPPGQRELRWPPYTIPELAYKELSLDLAVGRAKRARQCHLLNSYIPSLAKVIADTDLNVREWKNSFSAWQRDMARWREHFENFKLKKTCP